MGTTDVHLSKAFFGCQVLCVCTFDNYQDVYVNVLLQFMIFFFACIFVYLSFATNISSVELSFMIFAAVCDVKNPKPVHPK